MSLQFLLFAEQIIAKAIDHDGEFTYDIDTMAQFDYDFKADDEVEIKQMQTIASSHGFSFEPVVIEDDIVIGFTISK